jgi:hypothetical protein
VHLLLGKVLIWLSSLLAPASASFVVFSSQVAEFSSPISVQKVLQWRQVTSAPSVSAPSSGDLSVRISGGEGGIRLFVQPGVRQPALYGRARLAADA